ncbi:MAG: GNAT family N-acetyltransferase [Bdellovibrionota bacterium]|nr:GNAT family N-acetyltransferase [Bdellovibrionota bacterium]
MLEIKSNSPKRFFEVTENSYGSKTPFVSVLKSDLERFLSNKNPLFSKYGRGEFFVAMRDGKAVGRIVAHIHEKSNRLHNLSTGYFGYFDCEDNPETAEMLLAAAEQWCKNQGVREIAGNFNLTAMQQIGVMTEGFENTVYTDQVYSPPHIAKFLKENGYEAYFPMTTFELDLTSFDPEVLKTEKVSKLLNQQDMEFKALKKKNFEVQMNDVRKVLNDGFKNNPMFVPVTEEEFMFQAKDMMWVIDEHISYMAYENARPVGTNIVIPDLNPFLKATDSKIKWSTPYHYIKHKRNCKRAIMIFSSIVRDKHGIGLNPAIMYKTTTALKDRGYEKMGITWIADVNPASLRQMEKLGAKKLHNLNLFKKEL